MNNVIWLGRKGEPPDGTDLQSYPSHRFAAGPSHSRAMGGYAVRRLFLEVTYGHRPEK